MNEEFYYLVEVESEKRLQQKELVEWPRFLEEHITPICRSSVITQLQNMMCPSTLQCDKCGIDTTVSLTPDIIAKLMKKPKVGINCSNLNCRDWGMPHKIELTLGEVFHAIVDIM